ncbi:MAG TPA: hypothetical protein DCY94_03830, partial [Firmicutes bacterium]|nr:hypothetical protein [Bacillota bacterium]
MQEVTEKDISTGKQEGVKTFLNPRYVFIPIKNGFKLRVRDNEYIYKNDIVGVNRSGKMIHSSISGRVLGVKTIDRAKLNVPSLVIENDFKENIRVRKSSRKFLSGISKNEFLNSLDDAGLTYKGKYVKEKFFMDRDILVVNGIDLEPGFHN